MDGRPSLESNDMHEINRLPPLTIPLLFSLTIACTPGSEDGDDEAASASESESGGECSVGTLGCECLEGLCLGGLECVAGICEMPGGSTTDSDSSDSDTSSTDTDSDTTDTTDTTETGDGDGDGPCDIPTGTNEGCEFHAMKLALTDAQVLNQMPATFAVTNSGAEVAEVVIERLNNGSWTTVHGPVQVQPMATEEYVTTSPADIVYFGLSAGDVFRIRSTRPVVAHQFNSTVASSFYGASLLLPTAGWDWNYRVVSTSAIHQLPYAVVTAATDGTSVEVELKDAIEPGPGIPAQTGAGTVFSFELDAGETFGLFADPDAFYFGGTRITSDPAHPIGVFTGTRGQYYGHGEDQMLGVNQWGLDFVCPHIRNQQPIRNGTGIDWRVYSAEPVTFFEFAQSGGGQLPVGQQLVQTAGNSIGVESWVSFTVTAAKPVAVVPVLQDDNAEQYYKESFAMIPAVDRLLDRYVVYAPDGPYATHVLTVIRADGATVTVDGAALVPYETKVVVPGWEMVRFTLTPGAHELLGSEPFLAVMNGWGSGGLLEQNYMYVAGMAL